MLWTTPATLIPLLQSAEDKNREIKRSRPRLQELVPPGEPVAFFGGQYWLKASPLLYYAERQLDFADATAAAAVQRGRPAARLDSSVGSGQARPDRPSDHTL